MQEEGWIKSWSRRGQHGYVSWHGEQLFRHAAFIADRDEVPSVQRNGLAEGDHIAFDIAEPKEGQPHKKAQNAKVLATAAPVRPDPFRPGDWCCKVRGFMNFASRQTCGRCTRRGRCRSRSRSRGGD